ncbi:hypothetical protein [Nocardia sp. NPDC050435]|uniref:hypothetical protein n=1 Tax=Nocardia sp. NPDC050435 TaxID=3155040 RepID=UPI0033CCDAA9
MGLDSTAELTEGLFDTDDLALFDMASTPAPAPAAPAADDRTTRKKPKPRKRVAAPVTDDVPPPSEVTPPVGDDPLNEFRPSEFAFVPSTRSDTEPPLPGTETEVARPAAADRIDAEADSVATAPTAVDDSHLADTDAALDDPTAVDSPLEADETTQDTRSACDKPEPDDAQLTETADLDDEISEAAAVDTDDAAGHADTGTAPAEDAAPAEPEFEPAHDTPAADSTGSDEESIGDALATQPYEPESLPHNATAEADEVRAGAPPSVAEALARSLAALAATTARPEADDALRRTDPVDADPAEPQDPACDLPPETTEDAADMPTSHPGVQEAESLADTAPASDDVDLSTEPAARGRITKLSASAEPPAQRARWKRRGAASKDTAQPAAVAASANDLAPETITATPTIDTGTGSDLEAAADETPLTSNTDMAATAEETVDSGGAAATDAEIGAESGVSVDEAHTARSPLDAPTAATVPAATASEVPAAAAATNPNPSAAEPDSTRASGASENDSTPEPDAADAQRGQPTAGDSHTQSPAAIGDDRTPSPTATGDDRTPDPTATGDDRTPDPTATGDNHTPNPTTTGDNHTPDPTATGDDRVQTPAADSVAVAGTPAESADASATDSDSVRQLADSTVDATSAAQADSVDDGTPESDSTDTEARDGHTGADPENPSGITASPLPAHRDEWEQRVLDDPNLLEDIAFAIGGPFHLMYPQRVARNIDGFREVFTATGVEGTIYYGKKANKAACVARVCAENDTGVDVSSVGELTAALGQGVRGAELMVTGPAKSDDLLWLAVRHGALIALDALDELERLERIASTAAPARVLLRVLPEGSESRFGLSDTEIGIALSVIGAAGPVGLEPIQLEGFSFHLSGYSAEARAEQAGVLIEHCLAARELGHPITTISIGGGFGVDYVAEPAWREFTAGVRPEWFHAGKSFEDFYPYHFPAPGPAMLAAILEHGGLGARLREHDLRLAIEPGRALLDGAGSTVFRVRGGKTRRSGDQPYQLITVDGTSLSLSEQWFDSEFLPDPVLWPQGPGAPTPASVGAATCLESDMLSWRRVPLPRPAAPGDLLVYPNTAGYQMDSNESAFHDLPIPPKVVLHDAPGDRFRWTLES